VWIQIPRLVTISAQTYYREDVTQLKDINDIRNGLFALHQIHMSFEPRSLGLLFLPYQPCLISPPLRLPITFSAPLTSPGAMGGRPLQISNFRPTAVISCGGWTPQIQVFRPSFQTIAMLRLKGPLSHQNRPSSYCTVTMVLRPLICGDGERSSPEPPQNRLQ
jgi:hypothetical protein